MTQPSTQHIVTQVSSTGGYRKICRVVEWITRNGLRMNVDKTQLLVLNRKGKQSIADSVQVSVGAQGCRNRIV